MNYFALCVIVNIFCTSIILQNVNCANRTKNVTDTNLKPQLNEEQFKKDVQKFARDCGASISGENLDENDNERHREELSAEVIIPRGFQRTHGERNAHWAYEGRMKSNKATYPTHYGPKRDRNRSDEDSAEEDDEQDDDRGGSNRRNWHRRRNNRNKDSRRRSSSEYEESKECDDDHRKDSHRNNRNQWGSGWSNLAAGTGTRYNDPFGVYSSPDLWTRTGYSIYGGRLMVYNQDPFSDRLKREYPNEQCTSQCVFGYMEMLDDNLVPAETEVVRYFQDKIVNTNERVRLITLARRCFAKLSTTDNDDGCSFSKELAHCLDIHVS